MTHRSYAVDAAGLRKSFRGRRAVDGLDLAVPAGTVVGLLGPNGAGKTTTVRMLATLLRPDSGIARVFGHDVVADAAAVRALIGLTGQFASIDADLSGRENLVVQARLLGLDRKAAVRRAGELLEQFDAARASGLQRAVLSLGVALAGRRTCSPSWRSAWGRWSWRWTSSHTLPPLTLASAVFPS